MSHKMTSVEEEWEKIEFVKKASECFKEHPEFTTYTVGDVEPGVWFAVRWGMGNDCVLVFKIDENVPVTNYQQAIK